MSVIQFLPNGVILETGERLTVGDADVEMEVDQIPLAASRILSVLDKEKSPEATSLASQMNLLTGHCIHWIRVLEDGRLGDQQLEFFSSNECLRFQSGAFHFTASTTQVHASYNGCGWMVGRLSFAAYKERFDARLAATDPLCFRDTLALPDSWTERNIAGDIAKNQEADSLRNIPRSF